MGSVSAGVAAALVTLVASLGVAAPVSAAPPPGLDGVPDCRSRPPGLPTAGRHRARLHIGDRVDVHGTLTGYVVRDGGERVLRLGPGGFVDGPFGGVVVAGEWDEDGTDPVLLELRGPATDRGPAGLRQPHGPWMVRST